jgi:hypothetical protein
MDEVTRFRWSGSWWALAIGHDAGHPRILGCGPERRSYLIVPTRGIGRIIAEQGVNGRWDPDTGKLLGHPAPFDGWSACVVCLDERERREWLYQTVWRPRGPSVCRRRRWASTTSFAPLPSSRLCRPRACSPPTRSISRSCTGGRPSHGVPPGSVPECPPESSNVSYPTWVPMLTGMGSGMDCQSLAATAESERRA